MTLEYYTILILLELEVLLVDKYAILESCVG